MTKSILTAVTVVTYFAFAPAVALAEEQDAKAGEELFKFHGCANCHGESGKQPISKMVPELAGKPADDLYSKASKILAGKGDSEEAKLMHAAVYSPASCNAPPTADQVKTITQWLSAQQ
jgi:mono/diheme cytochrome c family protein